MNKNQLSSILNSDQSVLIISKEDDFSPFIKIIAEKLSVNKEDVTDFYSEEGVESLREKINRFQLKPNSSPLKIFVIYGADSLNKEQANTLLKTIEEPPRFGRLILSARNKSKIIPTILSRCHLFYHESETTHERESIISLIKKSNFGEYLSRVKKIDKKEALNLLQGGLEEMRQKGFNKAKGQIFEQIGNSIALLESTKCNHRLVLERLYILIKAKEE